MDGSKMEDKPFAGFMSTDIKDGHSRKFRIAKIASTFTAEALAIDKILEIIEKTDLEQNFMIFSDLACVLKDISNSSTRNKLLHITQMPDDKIKIFESLRKKIQFYRIPGHCGVEVYVRASNQGRHR
jgi:hypothetical protein